MPAHIQLLDPADSVRKSVSTKLALANRAKLGQYMTPAPIARFMSSLFPPSTLQTCVLLDAGAGVGSLSSAFLDRWAMQDGFLFQQADVETYEIDPRLRNHLAEALTTYSEHLPIRWNINSQDFIEAAALQIMAPKRYTHVILNPPYKKIDSRSSHRIVLRKAGIETVNLYSAFVALSLALMKHGGHMVAILPRSFCNGPYYRPFREYILQHAALHHLHLFTSRTKAFQEDGVLQENVIIRLECGGEQGSVTVSHSTDDTFSDLISQEHLFTRIVFPQDSEKFIHVPTSSEHTAIELSKNVRATLSSLGITVSTGPIVDFRLLEHIQTSPKPHTVPLLYPGHFREQRLCWPKEGIKHGNAICMNASTKKWLYPNGFYTVVRRFSSKEEKRRIVASVVRPDAFPGNDYLGFENHLNVFHIDKHGLPEAIAYGLAAYLNTSAVDAAFRRFNGHTQVNATDLRNMLYPDQSTLRELGEWARGQSSFTQTMTDQQVRKFIQ